MRACLEQDVYGDGDVCPVARPEDGDGGLVSGPRHRLLLHHLPHHNPTRIHAASTGAVNSLPAASLIDEEVRLLPWRHCVEIIAEGQREVARRGRLGKLALVACVKQRRQREQAIDTDRQREGSLLVDVERPSLLKEHLVDARYAAILPGSHDRSRY